ncbi:XRE family transcriptional regulator [Enterococcus silesiacus]|uniref:XRE family transcriptional regulator n=1 Tax=Enterococcus silesiacus TaxID=332949 RepID=A0A0S3K6Q4_9ENTE|nr:helix-turn-helix transcriptional regulator [Enterococcus silesiacus]ALR99962.1 XRE family transcriptional regulator [Enterococcus silesiacus]OJG92730.1 XRE family transcriptional regulator [Enterococcus silesiacus]
MKKTNVHNNIRKLRFLKDEMTQQQLADLVGVSRQTIVAIEKEKYSPTIEIAFLIARVFDLPLEEVFTYGETDEVDQTRSEEK